MSNETIIIGGGPAGSAAAIHLARHGMPVRLLERQPGPHHKVCGEFISYEAAHHLAHLGLDLPALGAVPIRHARFYNGEQELTFDLPFTAWSLSRCLLDSALLEQAESAGATVECGTAVRQLSRVGDGWELLTSHRSASGHARTIMSAQTIFLASGKHELRDWQRNVKRNMKRNMKRDVKRDVKENVKRNEGHVEKNVKGPAFTELKNLVQTNVNGNAQTNVKGKALKNVNEEASNHFIGLKMHFSASASQQLQWREAVEIHLFNGGYAGLEPIENGGVNLCFLIKQDIYKACGGNWLSVLDWLGNTSSHMQQRLAHLTPQWQEPLAVAGVPYGYIASPADSVPNLFRLGDQAAVIPSFAGDGIAIALHTASLAAQVHIAGGNSNLYQRQACKDLTAPVRNAKRLADLLSHRLGRNAAFGFARLWPKRLRAKLLKEMTRRTRVGLVSDTQ